MNLMAKDITKWYSIYTVFKVQRINTSMKNKIVMPKVVQDGLLYATLTHEASPAKNNGARLFLIFTYFLIIN